MKVSTRVKKLEEFAGATVEEKEPFNELFQTMGLPEEKWPEWERSLREDGFHTQQQFAEYLLKEVDGATRGLKITPKERKKR